MTKYIEEHHFTFDRSYDENSTNENVKFNYRDCLIFFRFIWKVCVLW